MIRPAWERLTTASPAVLAAGLAALHLLAAALAFDPTPHSGGDNAAYLALARSLLDHGRYLQLWDPAAGPHAQYPPGFPAFLALAMAVGIGPWVRLKVLMVIISALGVALSYRWMRERAEPGIALGAGLLVALAPGIIENSHWILSDGPFWAAVMATLWLAARDRPLPAAATAFLALGIRTAGLPLVVAVVVWLALRRRWWHAAGVGAALAALGALWTLRASGTDVPYASELWLVNPYEPDRGTVTLGGLLARIPDNGERYALEILPQLLGGMRGVVLVVVAGAIVAFAALGWARRIRGPGLPEIFLPLYLGTVLLWPGPWAADRFLLPVLPVLLLLAAEGAGVLPRRLPAILRTGAAVLLLVGVALALGRQWSRAADCRDAASEFPSRCLHPEVRAFLALAGWMRDRLPDDAVALSRKPTLLYWFGDVPGRPYPFTRRPSALFEEADRAGARYLVVDRLGVVSRTYLLPVIAENPTRFCAIQAMRIEGAEAVLLGILPADSAGWGRTRTEQGELLLDMAVCPRDFLR